MTEHMKGHIYTVEADGEHWKVVDRLGAFTGIIATTSTIYGATKIAASLTACATLSNASLEAGVIEKMAEYVRANAVVEDECLEVETPATDILTLLEADNGQH